MQSDPDDRKRRMKRDGLVKPNREKKKHKKREGDSKTAKGTKNRIKKNKAVQKRKTY